MYDLYLSLFQLWKVFYIMHGISPFQTLLLSDINNSNCFHHTRASQLKCGPKRASDARLTSQAAIIEGFQAFKLFKGNNHMIQQMKIKRVQPCLKSFIQRGFKKPINPIYKWSQLLYSYIFVSSPQLYSIKELSRSEYKVCHLVICSGSPNAATRSKNLHERKDHV